MIIIFKISIEELVLQSHDLQRHQFAYHWTSPQPPNPPAHRCRTTILPPSLAGQVSGGMETLGKYSLIDGEGKSEQHSYGRFELVSLDHHQVSFLPLSYALKDNVELEENGSQRTKARPVSDR